jgi:Zn-finger nucleic acid-binding protein
MTTENVTIIDVDDIARFVFRCKSCDSQITVPADKEIRSDAVRRCQGCGDVWLDAGMGQRADEWIRAMETIRRIRNLNESGHSRFRFRFQIKPPAPSSGADDHPLGG